MPVYELNTNYADVSTAFIAEAAKTLTNAYARIEHCLNQLSDEELWWRPRPEMNAIGNLLLHLAGNLEQWIIAPIEKRPPNRDRPAEFTARRGSKAELTAALSSAVGQASTAITLVEGPDHLLAARRIQGYDTQLLPAIFHSVSHFEGHAQEIVATTRQIKGEAYQFLWTPKTPEQLSTK